MALPVLFKDVISHVCDLAEAEFEQNIDNVKNVRNYYVLNIMMGGMVDDLNETVMEVLRASDLPISINIINMSKDVNDSDAKKFISKQMNDNSKTSRDFIKLLNFELYKDGDGTHTDQFRDHLKRNLFKPLPGQIEKFYDLKNLRFSDPLFESASIDGSSTSNLSQSLTMSNKSTKQLSIYDTASQASSNIGLNSTMNI